MDKSETRKIKIILIAWVIAILIVVIIFTILMYPYLKYPEIDDEYMNDKIEEYENEVSIYDSLDNNDYNELLNITKKLKKTINSEVNNVMSMPRFSYGTCPNAPINIGTIIDCIDIADMYGIRHNDVDGIMKGGIEISYDYFSGDINDKNDALLYYSIWQAIKCVYAIEEGDEEDQWELVRLGEWIVATQELPIFRAHALLMNIYYKILIHYMPLLNREVLMEVKPIIEERFDPITSTMSSFMWYVVYYNKNFSNSSNKKASAFSRKYGIEGTPFYINPRRELMWYNYLAIKHIEYYEKWCDGSKSSPPKAVVKDWKKYDTVAKNAVKPYVVSFFNAYLSELKRHVLVEAIDKVISRKESGDRIDIEVPYGPRGRLNINDKYGCIYYISDDNEKMED